jgi:uncharacterized protein (TIGR00730 family)
VRRLCVFCGSSPGRASAYDAAARRLGARLAASGVTLVYGGGGFGLMGTLADAVLAGGGQVIGVIPRALVARELAHRGVADMRVVADMHSRKALMAELSDAIMALPGGFGTFDELIEAITWAQLGFHSRPIGLANVEGYFDPFVRMLDHAVAHGFADAAGRALVDVASDPEGLLALLEERLKQPGRIEPSLSGV